MREFFNFFIRNSKWFVFAAYLVASALLLIRTNPVHQSVYLTSANAVSTLCYDWFGGAWGYVNLRETNEDLNRRNAELLSEVEFLNRKVTVLEETLLADSIELPEPLRQYDFVVAHVIKNSVMKPHNYITINKGSEDGIQPEMGVIDQNGVVGVVNVVSPHGARIISLLNPYFRLSCKIKDNENFGSLVWDGADPRYALLEELPRHTVYNVGDTVVTSGYSSVFPPGIPVGVIEANSEPTANPDALRIRLLSDFSKLSNVQVVINYLAEEMRQLEEETTQEQ